jgi:hypothetical protein
MFEGASEDGLGLVSAHRSPIIYTLRHLNKKRRMKSCYLPPWSTSNDDESTTSEDTSPRGTKRRSTSIHSLYEPHAKAMTDSQGPKACHTRCHIYQRAVHRIFAFSQPKKLVH